MSVSVVYWYETKRDLKNANTQVMKPSIHKMRPWILRYCTSKLKSSHPWFEWGFPKRCLVCSYILHDFCSHVFWDKSKFYPAYVSSRSQFAIFVQDTHTTIPKVRNCKIAPWGGNARSPCWLKELTNRIKPMGWKINDHLWKKNYEGFIRPLFSLRLST